MHTSQWCTSQPCAGILWLTSPSMASCLPFHCLCVVSVCCLKNMLALKSLYIFISSNNLYLWWFVSVCCLKNMLALKSFHIFILSNNPHLWWPFMCFEVFKKNPQKTLVGRELGGGWRGESYGKKLVRKQNEKNCHALAKDENHKCLVLFLFRSSRTPVKLKVQTTSNTQDTNFSATLSHLLSMFALCGKKTHRHIWVARSANTPLLPPPTPTNSAGNLVSDSKLSHLAQIFQFSSAFW